MPAKSQRAKKRPAAAPPAAKAKPRRTASKKAASKKRTEKPSESSETASSVSPTDGQLRYLNEETLIAIHRAVAEDFSDSRSRPGEVDSALGLQMVVSRPRATVMGREAYPDFSDKAAALVFAILQQRPFASCNRRVALVALAMFSSINGKKLNTRKVPEKELESLLRRASSGDRAEADAATWFGEIRATLAQMLQ